MLALPLTAMGQKVTLGSCVTKDGGEYQGEMSGGKPQGKGRARYKNGDVYEGAEGSTLWVDEVEIIYSDEQ